MAARTRGGAHPDLFRFPTVRTWAQFLFGSSDDQSFECLTEEQARAARRRRLLVSASCPAERRQTPVELDRIGDHSFERLNHHHLGMTLVTAVSQRQVVIEVIEAAVRLEAVRAAAKPINSSIIWPPQTTYSR